MVLWQEAQSSNQPTIAQPILPQPTCIPHLLQYMFTAVPVGGGKAISVVSSTPSARFRGLKPGSKASPPTLLQQC